jgi:SPP1 gp7 family putative phage head morphogenesis protein
MSEPIKTAINPGLIDRVVRGVKYVVSGASTTDWFSPQQPLTPFAPKEVAGRQFDYPVGYNVNIIPRAYDAVSFAQLRGLADNLDLLRLAIETRKDLMCKMEWEFKPRDPSVESDERCKQLNNFFRFPDQEHTWDEWLRMILEDLFVIDAPTLYPRMTYGGDLYALEPIDGATIKRVIDGGGRTPLPPEVAFQQILKGLPAVDYSRDELIYKPRNLRTNKVYGYSPVEQIIMTVNIALRRQVSQLQYYTDGSAPDMILTVPETWNPDQTRQFKDWWDSMLAGNTAARRGTMFVPSGVGTVNTKDGIIKDEYDEWLAKIISYAFSLDPQHLIKQMNRATAQSGAEKAKAEGLEPIMQWVKNLVDYVVWKYFGYKDLHLSWVESKDPDPLQQAQINQIYVTTGVKQVNEVREELGLEALAEPEPIEAPPPNDPPGAAMPDKNQDDAKKLEKRSKKAARELAPLNRQRRSIKKLRGILATRIDDKLKSYGKDVAAQVVAAYDKLHKGDYDGQVDSIIASLILNWDDLIEEIQPVIKDIGLDGVKAAAVQIDLINDQALDLANDAAIDYAKKRAAEMVGKSWVGGELVDNPNAEWRIDESTRGMLRSTVTQAMEEGWSNDKLASAIEESNGFSFDRAKMIARTETAMADVNGNIAAYKEGEALGIEIYKQWVTANDDLVSEDCQLNGDSDPLPMDEPFPSGIMWPPEHPNCRCDIVPVLFTDLVNQDVQ